MRSTITKLMQSTFPIILGMFLIPLAQSQTNHPVMVGNNFFSPNYLKIYSGDTVTWTNSSGNHNVNGTQETWPDNPESFGNEVGGGWTFQHVFMELGDYNYQCDPHVPSGMFGAIKVVDNKRLTLNFSAMTPHVGQDLWLAIYDKDSGREVFRTKQLVEESFSIVDSVLETGTSYNVDFYADFNQNGSYDAPPTDHAWRIELNDFMADTVIDFAHNTNFTDIEWQHKLRVDFIGMDPHAGQDIHMTVIDVTSGMEVGRAKAKGAAEFSLGVLGIEVGGAYRVDFFADFNGNGVYDAPPTDHAWQLEVDSILGDTNLSFAHNTDFTDVDWKYKLRVEFSGMTPHLDQMLKLYLFDKTHEMYVDSMVVDPLTMADFELISYAIMPGNSYNVDFFADFNDNGMYDAPPADHAWRIGLNNVLGDTVLYFEHNTSFRDIFPVEPSALSETESINRLQLFPNPAQNELSLSGIGLEDHLISLRIFDTQGQLVEVYQPVSQAGVYTLDIHQLDPGMYFLEVQGVSGYETLRFVKLK